jgi:hypothetical protein
VLYILYHESQERRSVRTVFFYIPRLIADPLPLLEIDEPSDSHDTSYDNNGQIELQEHFIKLGESLVIRVGWWHEDDQAII